MKIYKARRLKAWQRSAVENGVTEFNAAPLADPENEFIVKVSEPAEELGVCIEMPQTEPKVNTSIIKTLSQTIRQLPHHLKLQFLRHSVVKASAKSDASATQPVSSDDPQALQDGQIIPLRSRRNSRIASHIIATNRAEIATQAADLTNPTIILPTTLEGYFTPPVEHRSLAERVKPHLRKLRSRPSLTDLINAESKLGSMIFGPIPEGHRREFFHDRDNVWIWHEGWVGTDSQPYQMTVRYEVRPTGVFKKIAAGKYFQLTGDELENFRLATHAYLQTIKQNLYHRV